MELLQSRYVAFATPKTRKRKKKSNCKTGKPCGYTCIPKNRECFTDESKKAKLKSKAEANAKKRAEIQSRRDIKAKARIERAKSLKGSTVTATKEPLKASPVALFKEHLISTDRRINAETLENMWDTLDSPGVSERKAMVRQIINEQRIQAVFNDKAGSVKGGKAQHIYDRLEDTHVDDYIKEMSSHLNDVGLTPAIRKTAERYIQDAKNIQSKARHRSNGYTSRDNRHVVITTDSKKRKDIKMTADGIKSRVDRLKPPTGEISDVWSMASLTNEESSWGTQTFTTYLHEVGHQIQWASQSNQGSVGPSPALNKSLTEYGSRHEEEFFAEHFALWVMDANRLKELNPDAHDYIDQSVRAAIGKPRRINRNDKFKQG